MYFNLLNHIWVGALLSRVVGPVSVRETLMFHFPVFTISTVQ
jgi:hypothetical protein